MKQLNTYHIKNISSIEFNDNYILRYVLLFVRQCAYKYIQISLMFPAKNSIRLRHIKIKFFSHLCMLEPQSWILLKLIQRVRRYNTWSSHYAFILCTWTYSLTRVHKHKHTHTHTQNLVHTKVSIRNTNVSLATRKCIITHYQANIITKSLNGHLFE